MKREKISKEKIIDAFLSVSFQKSSSGTALSDIAESLGIKKASLYNHYDNRDAMVLDVMKFCSDALSNFSFPSIDSLSDFTVEFFKTIDTEKNLQILSLVESEKFFDDKAFEISNSFKIRLMKFLHSSLGAKTEFFVSAVFELMTDYISAKKMMMRSGDEIEFSEEKIRTLVDGFKR